MNSRSVAEMTFSVAVEPVTVLSGVMSSHSIISGSSAGKSSSTGVNTFSGRSISTSQTVPPMATKLPRQCT